MVVEVAMNSMEITQPLGMAPVYTAHLPAARVCSC